ncbi:unnamed protein product [Lampetra planeri]
MSLSPAIDADLPETANGVVSSISSENGPRAPVSVKCAGSREPCLAQEAEDASLCHTKNHIVGENRVYDGDVFSETEMDNNVSTASLSPDTAPETDSPLPATTRTSHCESGSKDSVSAAASSPVEPPGAGLLWTQATHPSLSGGSVTSDGEQTADRRMEQKDGETEKQDEEEDEKNETMWEKEHTEGRKEAESLRHYSSSAPGPSTTSSSPPLPHLPSDDAPCPPHVMAQVWVRNVRGMQDSKSLDEISQACGGGLAARGVGRGGQSEGRRATISSALELEGTVSHEGDLTNFITKNLEQKIKMSSKPSLDCSDSDCSGPIYRSRGLSRRPADIPPIDPAVLLDLQRHTQEVAHSVEMMMRSLNGTIQNMTALSVGYIQTYRDSVDSLGESVDMSIKGMYTLMARCEELDRSMQPIHTLAAQIRDIKRTLDALEATCK